MNYSFNFEDIYLYNIYSIMNNISLDLIFLNSENINIMILLIFYKFKSILLIIYLKEFI